MMMKCNMLMALKEKFEDYNFTNDRLDDFWSGILKEKEEFDQVFKIVKVLTKELGRNACVCPYDCVCVAF
jgi:hypothetical protein